MKYFKEIISTGLIAGLRSMSAPVRARNTILKENQEESELPGILNKPYLLNGLATLEFVSDKLPNVPDRIQPVSLTGRALAGALSAAAIAKSTQHNAYVAALAGGIAAIVASYGMFYLRTRLSKKTNIPDFALGMAEDALVVFTRS